MFNLDMRNVTNNYEAPTFSEEIDWEKIDAQLDALLEMDTEAAQTDGDTDAARNEDNIDEIEWDDLDVDMDQTDWEKIDAQLDALLEDEDFSPADLSSMPVHPEDALQMQDVHNLIRKAYTWCKPTSGFALLSAVEAAILEIHPEFDPSLYGYCDLYDLLDVYPTYYQLTWFPDALPDKIPALRCFS